MLNDEERMQLKQEIKEELQEEMGRGWIWHRRTFGKRPSIIGLALIAVGVYLILPSFGIPLPPVGKVILPILLIFAGIALLR